MELDISFVVLSEGLGYAGGISKEGVHYGSISSYALLGNEQNYSVSKLLRDIEDIKSALKDLGREIWFLNKNVI